MTCILNTIYLIYGDCEIQPWDNPDANDIKEADAGTNKEYDYLIDLIYTFKTNVVLKCNVFIYVAEETRPVLDDKKDTSEQKTTTVYLKQ